MDLSAILNILYAHRDRIIAKYNAIANGNEASEPKSLYYLQGMLDQINTDIEVFESVIKSNAEITIRVNELLSKFNDSRGVVE